MARLSVECYKFLNPLLLLKSLILQLCLRSSSPFHAGKILIYAMPNADNHKIDLKAP